MTHLIQIDDLSEAQIADLISLSEDILENRDKYQDACRRKTMATLFFEPSTRTRLSFEAAMLELGGNTLGFADPNSSSAAKGESIADTIRTVGCYSDIIVMRHPKEGAPYAASLKSPVPIINAGDGGHHHPTQTLADLFTIHREKGRLDNLVVGLCGDLMFGRTVHSLIYAMARHSGITFVLISPDELRAPDYILDGPLSRKNLRVVETNSLEAVIGDLDILYMTRVQRERFFNEADYVRLKDSYVLTRAILNRAKPGLRVLHPLPRVNEIAVDVDDDPRACYFKQVFYGKIIRKALLTRMLENG